MNVAHMEFSQLNNEVAALARDESANPSQELIQYAAERGWLNASWSNAANNLDGIAYGERPSKRDTRIQVQWRILRGFLQDHFAAGGEAS
jgi:hypothetical protein